MSWRSEHKALNDWLAKKQTKFKGFKDATSRSKRNIKRKRAVEAERRWRRKHPQRYRAKLLRLRNASKARRTQELQGTTKVSLAMRKSAQFASFVELSAIAL